MYPKTVELNNSDFELIREVLEEIKLESFRTHIEDLIDEKFKV